MDEIKERIQEAAGACAKAYEAWRAKPSDHSLREALMESVHEWRKVGARLEIELAVADRQQNPNDPIPIPSHRAARRGGPGAQGAPADDIGNRDSSSDDFSGGNRGPRGPRQGGPRPAARPRDDDEGGSSPASGSGKPLSLKRASTTEE